MLECIVALLLIIDRFLFLLDLMLHLFNVIVFVCKVSLEIELVLLLIRVFHQGIFLDQLVLKVFEKTIINLFEAQNMLIVIGQRDTLTHHYNYHFNTKNNTYVLRQSSSE